MILLVRSIDLSPFSALHDSIDDRTQIRLCSIFDNLGEAVFVRVDKRAYPVDLGVKDVACERKAVTDLVTADNLRAKAITCDSLTRVVVLQDGDEVLDSLQVFVFLIILRVELPLVTSF